MARNAGIHNALAVGAVVVILSTLGSVAGAQAPVGPRRQEPALGMAGGLPVWGLVARRLNLTPEQRQGIRQLVQGSNLPQLRREVATARRALAGAIVSGQDPTAAALQLGTAEAQLTSQAAVVTAQAFRTILTDAQREQARQLWAQMQQNQQRRRQGQGGV